MAPLGSINGWFSVSLSGKPQTQGVEADRSQLVQARLGAAGGLEHSRCFFFSQLDVCSTARSLNVRGDGERQRKKTPRIPHTSCGIRGVQTPYRQSSDGGKARR